MKNKLVTGIVIITFLIVVFWEVRDYYRIVDDNQAPDIVEEHNKLSDSMREHCKQMPKMPGCEAYTSEKSSSPSPIMWDHSMMMDHSAMVTSEEAFVVNMIPHHQEAVDTARLVVAKGDSLELKKLAQAIITAQEKEIAMMQKWSTDWKYSTVTPSYQNMMGDGTKLSGKALDTWFLQGMIMHHEWAVQMAEKVLQLNARKEVADFAREVIRVQSSEISQMKSMLGEKMMMFGDHH